MKKLIKYSLIILLIIGILCYAKYLIIKTTKEYDSQLYVYNWGEYIDPSVINDFETLYNIDVVYETYDSNETLYAKVKNNNNRYDVIFPSEYMLEKMVDEQLIIPFNQDLIPNKSQINPDLLAGSNVNYGLPYFWGSVGIIYDPQKTSLDFTSWNDLWDPSLKNQVILVDSAREVLGFSLQSLGYSLNTTNKQQLRWALDKLITLRPNIKAIIGDEILQTMSQGEATAALTWSGSAKYIQAKNHNLKYVIPNEGTNIWIDNVAIPKSCQNLDGAHQFINYLMDSNIAKKNSDYVGYSTTNSITQQQYQQENDFNPIYYPNIDDRHKYEFYHNLTKEDNMLYNDLFLEFKMF